MKGELAMVAMVRNLGSVCAAVAALAWTAQAQAQAPLSIPESDGGFLPWAVAGGIAALVVVPAFLNPKRSHLN